MKSYAVIVNPTSGKGQALRKAEALLARLSEFASAQLLATTHRGAATELAAEAASRVDRIIAIGGDGTLNEVLNGLMNAGLAPADLPELGFLPAGTANAAVRAFGLASDPDAVATALINATSIPLDVGMVRHEGGQRAFLLWCGAGWDAVIIDALNATRSGLMGVSGLIGHLPQVLSSVARYKQPEISTEVDASEFGNHSTVIIANVGPIGFGGRVTDAADPGDGHFDVVGVPPLTALSWARFGFRMMASTLADARGVRHSPGSHITLRADGRVPFHLDGEPVGILPAKVTLMHGAVRLLKT